MKRMMTAIGASLLLLAAACPSVSTASDREAAEAERAYKFMQGVVSAQEGMALLVNETQKVLLTTSTKVYDSDARESGWRNVSAGKWVYFEGPINRDGSVTAEKVYLLPSYIKKNDRQRYPFMQLP